MVAGAGECCNNLVQVVAMGGLGLALACAGAGCSWLSLAWGLPDGVRGSRWSCLTWLERQRWLFACGHMGVVSKC